MMSARWLLGWMVLSGALPAAARDLTVALPANADAAVLRSYTQATHVPARVAVWNGSADALRRAQRQHRWDVVRIAADPLLNGCEAGVLVRVDAQGCGIAAARPALVLGWNPAKLSVTPDWGAFWDVARLPGRRGLRRGARGTLEIALMADGVAPGDVYRVLRGPGGVDRAFRKLDQLRPYLVWWDQPAEAARLLASGGVLMTSAMALQITPLHLATQPKQAIESLESWATLTNSPKQQAAGQFIRFAADHLPPASADALQSDAPFWRDNAIALDHRFSEWLADH